MLAALGCGLLAVLSQAPVSVPWVLFVSLPVLFVLWSRTETPRRAFGIGWAAGVGYFAGGLHWIAEPFLVDAATFGWMIPFAIAGMSMGLALFWGAGFWLAKQFVSRDWSAPFVFAGSWLAFEWLRGNILTGFPWGLLGYAWVDTPAIQSAAWVGIYGVTLWTVLAGTLLGSAFLARGARRARQCVAPVALVLLAWVCGIGAVPAETGGDRPLIGLVQPNVAQKDKWRPDLRDAHLKDLLDKTRALSEQGADIVIWPEAASPYPITEAPGLRTMIADALKPGGVLLAGGLRFEARGTPGQQVFNSLIAVDNDGQILSAYDKQHLVPFGEFLPFDDFLTELGLRAMAALPGGMSSGEAGARAMALPGLPKFVPMICYEAIFPAEILPLSSDAEWLVQVTNDAWFGSVSGPYQHLAQARVRAIERGLPLARAANTGVSAVIGARGEIRASIALNEPGMLLAALPDRAAPTDYSRFEDIPFILCVLLALSLGVLTRARIAPRRSH